MISDFVIRNKLNKTQCLETYFINLENYFFYHCYGCCSEKVVYSCTLCYKSFCENCIKEHNVMRLKKKILDKFVGDNICKDVKGIIVEYIDFMMK